MLSAVVAVDDGMVCVRLPIDDANGDGDGANTNTHCFLRISRFSRLILTLLLQLHFIHYCQHFSTNYITVLLRFSQVIYIFDL